MSPAPVLARGDVEAPDRLPEAAPARQRLHFLDGLRADLWIMHDVGDELAPIEESRRLYDAVGERPNVNFTEFSFFQHVDPSEDGGFFNLVSESWKLLRHLYRIVRWTT